MDYILKDQPDEIEERIMNCMQGHISVFSKIKLPLEGIIK